MKILVAEDDRMSRRLLQRTLEKWGHEVVAAEDGEEAWRVFEKTPCPIVISDWEMPNVDGLELVRRVRGREQGGNGGSGDGSGKKRTRKLDYTYVILLTARSDKSDVVAGMEAGADDFLSKPFHQEELRARLNAGQRVVSLERDLAEQNRELESAYARIKRDLDAAARIQNTFLPHRLPDIPSLEIAWSYKPCDELAGDMLNVVQLDDEHVGLYVLDVSGHGVQAALLSVSVSRTLVDQASNYSLLRSQDEGKGFRIADPTEVAKELNRRFPWTDGAAQFFTYQYGILNLNTTEFRYVSAGHPGPVYVPAGGKPEMIYTSAFPIGLGDGIYEEHFLALKPADRLLLFSDGVPEARNAHKVEYGENRLLACMEANRDRDMKATLTAILREVHDWLGGGEFKDDISLLGIEVGGRSPIANR